MKPSAILKKLKLAMPIEVAVEDPLTRQPIIVSYENLHSLLVLDLEHLDLEAQVISNLYAEMARIERAFQFEAAKADGRYRTWRSKIQDELREDHKKKKLKAPTQKALEDHYRGHEDYDEKSSEGKRYEALSGFFSDLKWAFKMKSEMLGDQNKMVAGFERASRNESRASDDGERLSDYENIAQEAARIAAESGSSESMRDLLSSKTQRNAEKPPKAPRPIG